MMSVYDSKILIIIITTDSVKQYVLRYFDRFGQEPDDDYCKNPNLQKGYTTKEILRARHINPSTASHIKKRWLENHLKYLKYLPKSGHPLIQHTANSTKRWLQNCHLRHLPERISGKEIKIQQVIEWEIKNGITNKDKRTRQIRNDKRTKIQIDKTSNIKEGNLHISKMMEKINFQRKQKQKEEDLDINRNNIHPPPEIEEVLNFFNSKKPIRDHERCHAYRILGYSVAKECERIGEFDPTLIRKVADNLWKNSTPHERREYVNMSRRIRSHY
ncbi:hypothetical protein Glove_43g39 [Diversispora epigaea]|uniref:Uncharacterized protein n=1 Tax=Diversispora epigaea TaxID=1348612 RepID=A0A397JNW1_9GLOM|nr:hypothetical protein Glove_43g39 [Diversispora epigaea]